MSVGARIIAAHDEILLTCSFCCRLTSVCRRATSAECTVSEWMRRAGEPDELALVLVDHPAEHGVEHSLRAEREQLRVLLEATPHRTHVGRLRVPDRDQEVGPREQVQLACASPAGCRSRRGCGASPPGGRPRRWRCRSGSWSSPLRTGARVGCAPMRHGPALSVRRRELRTPRRADYRLPWSSLPSLAGAAGESAAPRRAYARWMPRSARAACVRRRCGGPSPAPRTPAAE